MENFAGKQELLEILDKHPSAITEPERDILKARIVYLTEEQIEKFGLNPEEEPVKKSVKGKK